MNELRTSEEICEALVRHVEISGAEMFEKNFIKDDQILCSVFCIVGPNTEELTALIREWAHHKGLRQ